MKKKLLTLLVILTLALSLAVPAMAAGAPGSATINDNDGNNGTANTTTGVLAGTGADGTNTTSPADDIDDGTAAGGLGNKGHNATTANSQDIDVQARIVAADANIRYVVDIAWGTMQFIYSRDGLVWNPTSHKYESVPGATGEWLVDNTTIKASGDATVGYLDGINNRIVVINHSNAAVDAEFVYTATAGPAGPPAMATAFNVTAPATNNSSVVGGFYAANSAAVTGSALLAAPVNEPFYNTLNSVSSGLTSAQRSGAKLLKSGVGRNPLGVTGSSVTDYNIKAIASTQAEFATEAFFAFSGTPDTNTTITNFASVGKITVTITPNVDGANNGPGAGGY